jgi:hypothetical protein
MNANVIVKMIDGFPEVIFVGPLTDAESTLFNIIMNSDGLLEKKGNDHHLEITVKETSRKKCGKKIETVTTDARYIMQTVWQ